MRSFWRISNYRSLTGEGGLRYSARWHHAGRPIVYLAESPAGALLEVLVHLELEQDDLPRNYTLLRVTAPDTQPISHLEPPSGEAWKTDLTTTRSLGDRWLAEAPTAVARVPSAILPSTSNYLLNPRHPDANDVEIAEAIRAPFDPRLLKYLRGE